MFIPKESVEWKKVKYLKEPLTAPDDQARWKYELWLNEPLASWDVFSYWEKERVASMEAHLKKGDVLFDIGTEQGWCNLVYAQIVGPENMVLVEPTPEFWPNIQALWEKNFGGVLPRACYPGFCSNATSDGALKRIFTGAFPLPESQGDLIDRNSYKNLSDKSHTLAVEQITIDDFVQDTGNIPSALTIDVEGAELLTLIGAENTLRLHHPKLWVSVHEDLMEKNYQHTPKMFLEYITMLGYSANVLAIDHEIHVFCT